MNHRDCTVPCPKRCDL